MPMLVIARATLLMVCLAVYAGAQNRSLALYAGEANGLSTVALQSTQRELDRILGPTGLDMVWKDLELRRSNEQFDEVVVMTFEGSCSDTGIPANQKVVLADSSVSNGRVLPFIRVDCGYLASMLASTLRPMTLRERDVAFGRALGRVIAHEIYHISGQTTEHQERGVAKASFSVHDLTAAAFEFDNGGVAQMRPATPASILPAFEEAEEALER
jgi:hypothetical protein